MLPLEHYGVRPPEDRAFYSSGASPANRRWLPHGTNTGSRSSREALLAGDVQARGWIAAPETLSGFGRAAASNTRYGCRLKLLNHSGISAPPLTPALTSRGQCTRRKVSRSRGGGREQRRRPSSTAARSAGELGALKQGGTTAADLQPTQARRHRRAGVGTHSGDIARPPSLRSFEKGGGHGPAVERICRPGRPRASRTKSSELRAASCCGTRWPRPIDKGTKDTGGRAHRAPPRWRHVAQSPAQPLGAPQGRPGAAQGAHARPLRARRAHSVVRPTTRLCRAPSFCDRYRLGPSPRGTQSRASG